MTNQQQPLSERLRDFGRWMFKEAIEGCGSIPLYADQAAALEKRVEELEEMYRMFKTKDGVYVGPFDKVYRISSTGYITKPMAVNAFPDSCFSTLEAAQAAREAK